MNLVLAELKYCAILYLIMEKEKFMKMALKEAKKCEKFDDVPVGAVIVKDGKVISKAYNQKEKC